MKPIIILSTAPSFEVAKNICHRLVDQHLIACGQILPGITSIYTWEHKIQEEAEILILLKTVESQFPKVEEFILREHPYSIPEVISLPISKISQKYATWLECYTNINMDSNE